MTLGFLGTGAITSAMVAGLSSPESAGYSILVSPRTAETAAELARRFPGVAIASSNQDVVDRSEKVVIAVRPQIAADVLAALRFRAEQHVISLVAGYSLERLRGLVAPATSIARAVPLPSVARRRCPTAIHPHEPATFALFSALGTAFAAETEREFNAFCVVTATMATYFAFADGAASWLAGQGIAPDDARSYVSRIDFGLASTAVESPERSFHELSADHATRGGTNEQVLTYMTAQGVFDRFHEALEAVMRRVNG